MAQKIIVGLTGGFGVGKSAVAQKFRTLGAEVIDADEIAHHALKKGSAAFEFVAELFPEAMHKKGKRLDRAKIAEVVFKDAAKRTALEKIIHPYVFERLEAKIKASEHAVVLAEVPLLFEAGFDKFCDYVLVITCHHGIKRKRLHGKGFSDTEIIARERAQLSETRKAERADFIIDNSKTIYQTGREIEKLWYKLISLTKTNKKKKTEELKEQDINDER